jgi:threonine dehydrogenase-like Zn-dependent dehydrogenase
LGPRARGAFRYSHLCGGYAGGQAEYLRVPFADVEPIKVPAGLNDEQVLFLSDIFPTGYMACNIYLGDTVAIWGCGPVGQMAICSAFLFGAERVIAIDTVPERLELARSFGAITLDYLADDIYEALQNLTQGRGSDSCIDAVGTEADPRSGLDARIDRIKTATFMGTDRPHVLRQVIHCCRNFGTISLVGVYGGFLDKGPTGLGDQPRPDLSDGADAGAALSAAAPRAHQQGRDRPVLRHHRSRALRRRAAALQDLPRAIIAVYSRYFGLGACW